MKVRYIKNHTDEHGQFFPAGCVAEHPETEGMARIVAGVCKETDPDAYSRRQPLSAPLPVECVPAGTSIAGDPGPELVNVPRPKNPQLRGIYTNLAADIAKSEPANEGTITDRPPKKK
jgi:hypothetical protein